MKKAILLLSVLCMLLPFAGQADLVNTVNADTATTVDIDWTWNPEVADSDTPVLTNWDVTVAVDAVGPNWRVTLNVLHTTDPHAGEMNAVVFTKNYIFSGAANFGLVIDDVFSVQHPGGGHSDDYTFTFDRSMSPLNTKVTLLGEHAVPEPASVTLLLLATGVIGVFRRGIRR